MSVVFYCVHHVRGQDGAPLGEIHHNDTHDLTNQPMAHEFKAVADCPLSSSELRQIADYMDRLEPSE